MTPPGTQHETRPARDEDIDALTGIARACFAMAPEWRAPDRITRRWWARLIARPDCRVIVAADALGPAGFSIYVPDAAAWRRLERTGPHSRPLKLLVLATNPAMLRSRIAKRRRARHAPPDAGSPRADTRTPADDASWREAEFFIGLIAVLARCRGAGVGSGLLAETERHATERGARLVRLHMDPRNSRARSFYEAHGYRLGGRDGSSFVMVKVLP